MTKSNSKTIQKKNEAGTWKVGPCRSIAFTLEDEKAIHTRELAKIQQLESKASPLEELVIMERFNVDKVSVHSHANHITPNSEMMIGGRSPSYKAGFTTNYVIQVTPVNRNSPVKTLYFNGSSIVAEGYSIDALIPVFREEMVNYEPKSGFRDDKKPLYFKRELQTTEQAYLLIPYNESGKCLRSGGEKSVEYNSLQLTDKKEAQLLRR